MAKKLPLASSFSLIGAGSAEGRRPLCPPNTPIPLTRGTRDLL